MDEYDSDADLWDDFEDDDMDTLALMSQNIRDACGFEEGEAIHAGDGDEGIILWKPPEFSGLDNSQGFQDLKRPTSKDHNGDAAMWDELTQPSEKGNPLREEAVVSETLLAAIMEEVKTAVDGLKERPEQAITTAVLIQRLAHHGRGTKRLTLDEFRDVLGQIKSDVDSKALLNIIKKNKRQRKSSKVLV